MIEYRPGSFFLVGTFGWVGWIIAVLQALAGRPSRYSHAGLIIDRAGTIIEAEPGGARIRNIHEYDGRALLLCDGPVQRSVAEFAARVPGLGPKGLADHERILRARIVRKATALRGVPYSFADYLALAALHLHLPSKWIRRRVQASGHLICSQLVDLALTQAGVKMFKGKLPGDVMPADLAWWAEDYTQQLAVGS